LGPFSIALVTQYSSLSEDFVLFGFLTPIIVEKALAALVVALFAYISYRGAEETGAVGVVVTSIKIVILGVFVVFGVITTFDDPNWGATFTANPSFGSPSR
jgi:amino acid transporter